MGQIISFICRCTPPKPNKPKTHQYDQSNLATPLLSHNITIFDTEHVESDVVETSNTNLALEKPHIILDLSQDDQENDESEKDKKPAYHDHGDKVLQVVVEENVCKQEVITKIAAKVSTVPKKKVKKIGPYNSSQKLLLVGEGDFSFSTSLAVAFGSHASNIIATSLNSQDFLIKNYRKFVSNKNELEMRGSMVIHGVDATKLVKHPLLGSLTFDRIIFNFPHTAKFGRSESELSQHKNLVRGILKNAKKLIEEDGQIHITHKTSWFYLKWDIPKLGSDQGLRLIQVVKFKRSKYPGYETKYEFGGDKNFDCHPSKTYKFGLPCK